MYPNLAVVEAEAGAGPVRDHEGRAAGGGRGCDEQVICTALALCLFFHSGPQ